MPLSQPKVFITELQKLAVAKDRGALADLRHGVAGAAAHRAWPHLAPFCDLRNEKALSAYLVVGAGFAMHETTAPSAGNFGNTLRRIAVEGKGSDKTEALNSFAARFRRLLTCDTTEEVCKHLPGILRAAARKAVPVNYGLLLEDLLQWDESVKLRWASAYWGTPPAESANGGHEQ